MRSERTPWALAITSLSLLSLLPTAALAARQPTTRARLTPKMASEFNAYCNDGSRPSYSVALSTSTDPVRRRSWLVFFQGGGTCDSDERCIARWNDLPYTQDQTEYNVGVDDGEIGSHYSMSSVDVFGGINASPDFDGGGILDFDGIGPVETQAVEQSNPFGSQTGDEIEGFNRLFVHYCSSDGWRGRGATRRLVLSDAQVEYNAGPRSLDYDLAPPGPLRGAAGANIVFAGANIADAVMALILRGDLGGSDRIPTAPEHELVISGSSGGAMGVITNLDAIAARVRAGGSDATVYGVIDSVTAVVSGAPDRPTSPGADGFWAGAGAGGVLPAAVRTEWDLATGLDCAAKLAQGPADAVYADNPYYCSSQSNLVRTELETPFIVGVNSFDVVIHPPLLRLAKITLTRALTGQRCNAALDTLAQLNAEGALTDEQLDTALGLNRQALPICALTAIERHTVRLLAQPWVRNAITDNVSAMGEGTRVGGLPESPKRVGYYVPNYEGLHQLIADGRDQRFFYSDATAESGAGLDPRMGAADAEDAEVLQPPDTTTFAMTVRRFRDRVMNLDTVSESDYQRRNRTWTDDAWFDGLGSLPD